MRLMTYNILEGGTGRIDPLAEVIRLTNPDIVILQETTDEADFHKLADRLHMDRFLAENPRNPQGSAGLLTRLPIREAVNLAALDPRLTKAAFSAIVEGPSPGGSGSESLALLGLHLHHYETHADEAIRLTEIAALLEHAAKLPPAHLIAGDFNATHPDQQIDVPKLRAKTQTRIAAQNSQLPRDAIRTLLARGYVDTHALHRKPEEFQTSFTTSQPAMRVDYIFVPAGLESRVQSCKVFKPEMARFASDHFPVVAEMAL